MESDTLIIEGARQNNLRDVHLRIPHDRVTAITGISGSGKSSLAFDTIFAEGQWRYIESLSTYARLFIEKIDRPDVDAIRHVRPSIAIEQKNPVKTARSTVGTMTEIYDYLRLLYAKVGRRMCPACGDEVKNWTPDTVADDLLSCMSGTAVFVTLPLGTVSAADMDIPGLIAKGYRRLRMNGEILALEPGVSLPAKKLKNPAILLDRLVLKPESRTRIIESVEQAFGEGAGRISFEPPGAQPRHYAQGYQCRRCGTAFERAHPLLFSFNHPTGACAECKGFGNILTYDEDLIVPDKKLSLEQGAVDPWNKPANRWWRDQLLDMAKKKGMDTRAPFAHLSAGEKEQIFAGSRGYRGIREFFALLEKKRYKLHVRVFLSRYRTPIPCPACGGKRLQPDPLTFVVGGKGITEITDMPIDILNIWFANLALPAFDQGVAAEILRQIRMKLDFLQRVGLGYLTLSRQMKTLSGGEAQRISLANQLGSALTGTLYVLDEPTMGLHARDTARLADIIREIAAADNTVVVVEHDKTMIEQADHIVEMGPGGGHHGGHVVFSGTREEFLRHPHALTARYLRGESGIPVPMKRRSIAGKKLVLAGARGNNLRGIDLSVPLRTLTCVTGVSGAGKSTLVRNILYPVLARLFKVEFLPMGRFDKLMGMDNLRGVCLMDQEPIGKTPRSNPATYLKAFDDIRRIFSSLREARFAGLTAGHFSFNKAGGRCEACQGTGQIRMEMYFFEDLYVTCEGCRGRRFLPSVLGITYNGKNIADVLAMTAEEALVAFRDDLALRRKLGLLVDMGLGYLRLGQPAPTLSGGEAQRLKICAALGDTTRDILYILDEPTVGLHVEDVKKLLRVLNALVDQGNTVLIIEHNLEVVKTADYIVDLGPEGGEAGGRIIAQGTPEDVARAEESLTGRFLSPYLTTAERAPDIHRPG